jgi:hypothetical protein
MLLYSDEIYILYYTVNHTPNTPQNLYPTHLSTSNPLPTERVNFRQINIKESKKGGSLLHPVHFLLLAFVQLLINFNGWAPTQLDIPLGLFDEVQQRVPDGAPISFCTHCDELRIGWQPAGLRTQRLKQIFIIER